MAITLKFLWSLMLLIIMTGPCATPSAAARSNNATPSAEVDSLIAQMQSKDGTARQKAATRLGELGEKASAALPALLEAYATDRMWSVMPADAPAPAEQGAIVTIGTAAPGALLAQVGNPDSRIAAVAAYFARHVGGPGALEALLKATRSEDRETRLAAIDSLGWLQDPRAQKPLLELAQGNDERVRVTALLALCDFFTPPLPRDFDTWPVRPGTNKKAVPPLDPRVKKLLLKALRDSNRDVSRQVAEIAGRLGIQEARKPLLAMLKEDDGRNVLASEAMRGLAFLGAKEATPLMVSRLRSENGTIRADTVQALGDMKDPAAVEPLIAVAQAGGNPWRRGLAIRSLGMIGGARAYAEVVKALQSPDADVRQAAVGALGEMKNPASYDLLLAVVKDPKETPHHRADAAEALGKLGDRRATKPLLALLKVGDWYQGYRVARGLSYLRDPESIPGLIDAITVLDRSAPSEFGRPWPNPAVIALRKITGQDLGTKPEPWREWWQRQSSNPSPSPRP